MGKRKFESDDQHISNKKKTIDKSTHCNETFNSQPEISENIEQSPQKQNNFYIKHFRKDLSSKQGQTIVLTQFLQVCLNPDNEVDLILEYLKAGGNSHEILRQVNQENKKNLTLATPVFHIFHLIILKVQSSLPHMISITEEACRYFLNTFMPTVEIMISENSGPRHRKIILKLLTSIVTLNPDLGIEVLSQAPLSSKHLLYIVEKSNYKEKDNVRTSFVHFMTSFIVDNHLPLIKALLEKQGLLALVFPGLVYDDAEAVLMFLSILKKNVIENSFISKSLKLKTFSHQVLHNIFKIYSWKGHSGANVDARNQDQTKSEIMKLVSDIILTLFTSHKLGLYFIDNTLGTSDANKNQNLYRALLTLKRPWDNEYQCEVILEIVHRCPDLHRAIINIIEKSLDPTNSAIWEKTVCFVIKLMNKLNPNDMIPRMKPLNTVQVANFVRFITLPVPLLKHVQLSIGRDHHMSLYCVKLLVKMLQTLKQYIIILESQENRNNLVDLKNKIEVFFPKHLLAPNIIVEQIRDVARNDNYKNNDSVSQDWKLSNVEKVDYLILLLDLILLYNEIYPAYLESIEGGLNLRDILSFSTEISNDRVLQLNFKIVSLWIKLDSSIISLDNPLFKNLFNIMLEAYTSENETWIEAEDTLYHFLKETSIFEGDEDEIHLMLYTLRNFPTDPIALIGDVVEYVLLNIKELNEYIRNQLVNFELYSSDVNDSLNKLFKDLMKNRLPDDTSFLEIKIPSPFIVGTIQYTQNNKRSKIQLKNFLSMYITNLLHTNFSPDLTEVLIDDCKLDVRNYVASWIGDPTALPESIVGKDCRILQNMSLSIIKSGLPVEVVFPLLEASTNGYDIIINDVTYKIKSLGNITSSQLLVCVKYLTFCIVRLTKINHLQSEQITKITIYLKIIFEIAKKNHMTNVVRSIILIMLKNPHVLNIYKPCYTKKNQSTVLATKFILDFMCDHCAMISFMEDKYKIKNIYQEKNCTEILRALGKAHKNKKIQTDLILKALQVIGLTASDELRVVNGILVLGIESCITENGEPSLALEILGVLIENFSGNINFHLKNIVIKSVIKLYIDLLTNKEITVNLTNLENSLINYFENKPHQVKHVSEDNFKQFFFTNAVRKSTASLAHGLLKLRPNFCSIFKEEAKRQEILALRELTLPLGDALIIHNQLLIENKEFLNVLYKEYKQNIMKFLEKPHKAGQIYFSCWKLILKLIQECMDVKDCVGLYSKVHKFEMVDRIHIELCQGVFIKGFLLGDTLSRDILVNYILIMLNLVVKILKDGNDESVIIDIVANIYTFCEIYAYKDGSHTTEKNEFKKIIESVIWQNFCKAILKDCLKMKRSDESNLCGPKLLCLLTELVKLFYVNEHEDLTTLFDMVTSHSEFLNIMLSIHSTDIKSRLIAFIYILIVKNKCVMKTQHIPVYLSAYRASRSSCDRLLLKLLYFYESHGQPVNEYKPYIWGDSAANYYSVRKKRNTSLWSQPTPNQVINLFDKEIIERTIQNFPVQQTLNYDYELAVNIDCDNGSSMNAKFKSMLVKVSKDCFKSNVQDNEKAINMILTKSRYAKIISTAKEMDLVSFTHVHNDENVYDPAFVFPLLSHLLAPGSVASCFKLLRTGLLSLPVIALSSLCASMRTAAYHVLHRFCMILDTETRHKNDKLLLSDFMETLQHSLAKVLNGSTLNGNASKDGKIPRLPTVDALYLARALMVSTAPFDPLYKPINNFLIAKEFVDLTVVPDFLSLFHDSDVEYTERRMWMLDIIKDGTKTVMDVNVIFKTMCLKMIMDFYFSVLSDRKTKEKILGIINSLVSIPRALEILIEGYSVIPWLNSAVRHLNKGDKALVKVFKNVLSNALYSLLISSFSKNINSVKNGKTVDKLEIKINKDFENEILLISYELLGYIDASDIEDIEAYVAIYKLFSKRAIKQLSKRQMFDLITLSNVNNKYAEIVSILSKAVQYSDARIVNSKLFDRCIDQNPSIIKLHNDFKIFVENYIV